MGAIFNGDGGIIASVLIGTFIILLALVFVAVLTGIVILIVYFVKREDDFVIEEITIKETKKRVEKPKEEPKE